MTDLEGCPAAEHIGWLLAARAAGAATATVGEVEAHLLLPAGRAPEAFAARLAEDAAGPAPVDQVLGWRRSVFGHLVVTYRAGDGREHDLTTSVDGGTGRLVDFRFSRSSGPVDTGFRHPRDLTADERAGVHAVFDRAYRGGDHDYIDRQLDRLSSIGLGILDGRIVGFALLGELVADLPVIGPRHIVESGFTCVDPEHQGAGLSNAVGGQAVQGLARTSPAELGVDHFATPITLRANLRFGRHCWPGPSVEQWVAAYANPSTTQRAVGRALAELAGAADFDEDHFVLIGTGHPVGVSATVADLAPAYGTLFEHVDRSRGDTLLGISWEVDPPEVWLT